MRGDKWEGDIGVSCLCVLFTGHTVERISHMLLTNYNILRALNTFSSH